MTAPATSPPPPRTAPHTGAAIVATVQVSAAPAERAELVAQVTEAISRIAPAKKRTGPDTDRRLILAAGAMVRVIAAAPARPAGHPHPTTVPSEIVDEPGDLPEATLTDIMQATDRLGFTTTQTDLLAAIGDQR